MPSVDGSTLERIRGCFLGGAVGDALGAPIEFDSLARIRERFGEEGLTNYETGFGGVLGAVTDDTQMTLFTAEGITRAYMRGMVRGIVDTPACIASACRRWLHTQGDNPTSAEAVVIDGWLATVPELHHRRAPGNTCLSALAGSRVGSVEEPINDSKGCGGVMRVAPIGLFLELDREAVFSTGCDSAAITHGHPTGYLTAGALAEVIACIVRDDRSLGQALDSAEECLVNWEPGGAAETRRALEAARSLAAQYGRSGASPAAVESLGAGWVAEEALAIGVYCALIASDFASGVLLAANHSGDSDSTASIAGSILGALLGVEAIPRPWIDQLEVRNTIDRLCDDWQQIFTREDIVGEDFLDDAWATRYPPS